MTLESEWLVSNSIRFFNLDKPPSAQWLRIWLVRRTSWTLRRDRSGVRRELCSRTLHRLVRRVSRCRCLQCLRCCHI